MQTLKFQMAVSPSRQLIIDLPPGSEGGQAEVVVRLEPAPRPSDETEVARLARLEALLEHLIQTGPHTPKAELDRRIQEERDAWGD